MDLVEIDATVAEADRLDGGEIVGPGALVVECHVAVTLEVGNSVFGPGGVDRKLLVVDADTVAVGVRVGKQTGLQDWIGGRLKTGHHVSRIVGDLLDLGKVVLRVLIELKNADFAKWELLVRPDVCQVEDIDPLLLPKLFGLLGGHCLETACPGWILLTLNSLIEILLRMVGRLCGGVFLCNKLCTLV